MLNHPDSEIITQVIDELNEIIRNDDSLSLKIDPDTGLLIIEETIILIL